MGESPIQALRAAARGAGPAPARGLRLVIAGATGVLGNEVLRRLVGQQRYAATQVLAREPITAGLRGVGTTLVPNDDPASWPPGAADTGIVLFDPPRLFHDRERALWTPTPQQLPALAQWMRRSGVGTLAVVLPHAQARLPEALKRGLASLDEHAVATLGFDRLLIVRSAQKPAPAGGGALLPRLARFMLSVFGYMVPSSEQPVRSPKVAEFVSAALQASPPGIHIASSELVWHAAQGDVQRAVHEWLGAESG
ncbi:MULTISPECIES: hypothetical protein [Ramlibacter]|uniref:NAD(P)-binding domain-containing protein n=1 Tax=Ramlibacter pinisoli TaxID=2682844 RepID=A0A6N8IWR8_9BURK|nr:MULTISPECIES: hypothetical protein [Ramlibacter]MBA2965574.1 hypothetical protein [Ramlibacter sp. CGMCC 1.13660]MVQ30540.1 hypothetical protein [Ramlibacter pinisoli]